MRGAHLSELSATPKKKDELMNNFEKMQQIVATLASAGLDVTKPRWWLFCDTP